VTALFLFACNVGPSGGALPARRLSPTEYNNTVRDLYGFDDEWPEPCDDFGEDAPECSEDGAEQIWPYQLPPDVTVHGFEGMAEGQTASASHAESVQRAAAHFAPYVHLAPHFSVCGAWRELPAEDARSCVDRSVLRLAQRAWRRPATQDEHDRLMAFHDANVSAYGLEDGVVLTVQGILQSPQFLYLLPAQDQATHGEPLDDWQMASRLSYLLWDSMPDAELFEAASKGKLGTQAQVRRQAERMLQDPKARAMVVHFHTQWLEIDHVYTALPDMDTYANAYVPAVYELSGEELQDQEEWWSGALIGVRRGMVWEAERFVEHSIFDGVGTLHDLYTSHHGFVTDVALDEETPLLSTADIYGIEERHSRRYQAELDDGNLGFLITTQAVTFPADQRAGLLTLGAVLTAQSHPVHPAPVLRGKLVLERMLCTDLGQPPDNAAGQAPADTLDAEATNRERVATVTEVTGCVGCHQTLNPPGFALENYDSMGGWRTDDNGTPVDASGSFSIGDERFEFQDAVGLGHALGSSRAAHDCYVENWTRYAMGRTDSAADAEALRTLQDEFFDTGGHIPGLLVALASSELMRTHGVQGGE
jgi:hypothetical protein